MSLVAHLRLVHLRIALPVFVLGEAKSRYQGSIDDLTLPHRLPTCDEAGFESLKDLLAWIVLLQSCRKVRIVISSGMRLLNSLMQAKRLMVGIECEGLSHFLLATE